MNRALVGMGSNRGDRRANLRRALREMAGIPQTEVLRVSSLYETEPVGDGQDSNRRRSR